MMHRHQRFIDFVWFFCRQIKRRRTEPDEPLPEEEPDKINELILYRNDLILHQTSWRFYHHGLIEFFPDQRATNRGTIRDFMYVLYTLHGCP